MTQQNFTAEESAAVIKLLRDTIAADRYQLSPRIRTLKSALSKLDLDTTSPIAVEPFPAPKAWVNSSIGQRKRRARR